MVVQGGGRSWGGEVSYRSSRLGIPALFAPRFGKPSPTLVTFGGGSVPVNRGQRPYRFADRQRTAHRKAAATKFSRPEERRDADTMRRITARCLERDGRDEGKDARAVLWMKAAIEGEGAAGFRGWIWIMRH